MAISRKIKALVSICGKTHAEVAKALGISPQALSNKLHRDTFTAADLIKIADHLDCPLAFIVDDGQKIVLDKSDLEKGE